MYSDKEMFIFGLICGMFGAIGFLISHGTNSYALKKSQYECVETINDKCTTYVLKEIK
jgi:hypothetical protein